MEQNSKKLAEQMLKAHKEKRPFRFSGRLSVIIRAFEILKEQGELREVSNK